MRASPKNRNLCPRSVYLGELCARTALNEDLDSSLEDETNALAAIALGYMKLKSAVGAFPKAKGNQPGGLRRSFCLTCAHWPKPLATPQRLTGW